MINSNYVKETSHVLFNLYHMNTKTRRTITLLVLFGLVIAALIQTFI